MASPLPASAPTRAAERVVPCPWCGVRWVKDDACNWVCCGMLAGGGFARGGCGRQFCFACGLRLCGARLVDDTGARVPGVPTSHGPGVAGCECPRPDAPAATRAVFCPGGHNSHCARRW